MKPKLKYITIAILIIILVALSFTFLIRENLHALEINKLKSTMLNRERSYELTLTQMILTTDRLYKQYQLFSERYKKQAALLNEKEGKDEIEDLANIKYQFFEVTAYTSNECGFVTKIGIDLKSTYASYMNICAVDPDIIPLGSMVLIEFKDGSTVPYLACDTGGLIKGYRIDIYMTDVAQALEFGRQKLLVKIIERKSNE